MDRTISIEDATPLVEKTKQKFIDTKNYCGQNELKLIHNDDFGDSGIRLTWDPKTKIGMYTNIIFEGEHFDDYIDCNPDVGIFESADACFEHFVDSFIGDYNVDSCKDDIDYDDDDPYIF